MNDDDDIIAIMNDFTTNNNIIIDDKQKNKRQNINNIIAEYLDVTHLQIQKVNTLLQIVRENPDISGTRRIDPTTCKRVSGPTNKEILEKVNEGKISIDEAYKIMLKSMTFKKHFEEQEKKTRGNVKVPRLGAL